MEKEFRFEGLKRANVCKFWPEKKSGPIACAHWSLGWIAYEKCFVYSEGVRPVNFLKAVVKVFLF